MTTRIAQACPCSPSLTIDITRQRDEQLRLVAAVDYASRNGVINANTSPGRRVTPTWVVLEVG